MDIAEEFGILNARPLSSYEVERLEEYDEKNKYDKFSLLTSASAPVATKKVFKKKAKKEVKDVEPKLAAGKAKIYMKDKWGWKDAPSIPNRPSKGGDLTLCIRQKLSAAGEDTTDDRVCKVAVMASKVGVGSCIYGGVSMFISRKLLI